MKKTIQISIYLFFTLFLYSCSTELPVEYQTEAELPILSINKSNLTKRPGDGKFDALGDGYDVTGEYANPSSVRNTVIDIAKFKAENPDRFYEDNLFESEYKEEYAENALIYSKILSNKLTSTNEYQAFGKTISTVFGNSSGTTSKFDGKYIYGSYNITIKHKRIWLNTTSTVLMNYLNPTFIEDINTFTPETIVSRYGTHVLLDIYLGAKLEALFQCETLNIDRTLAARIGIKTSMNEVFGIDDEQNIDISLKNQNKYAKLSYKTRGGDPTKSLVGQVDLDQGSPRTIDPAPWQSTATSNYSTIVDFGPDTGDKEAGLVSIYNFVSDPVKKAALKAYVDQYLIDNGVNMEYKAIPIYRYYIGTGDHFYTQKSTSPPNYISEGIEFYAFNYKVPNTVPIYRYYCALKDDHFYSKSSVCPPYYVSEGIEFYAYENQAPNTIPIYRYYVDFGKGKFADHFYSRSPITPIGYAKEGIEFYAYPTAN